jgi:HEAT repeat protein
MKHVNKLTAALTALILAVLLASSLTVTRAQEQEILSKYKYAVENLNKGIQSDNEGLKRSSMYFAGKYKITSAIPTLIEQLNKEANPSNRILIALVLYKIGSPAGISVVRSLSKNDENQEVRRMAYEIYRAYIVNTDQETILSSN